MRKLLFTSMLFFIITGTNAQTLQSVFDSGNIITANNKFLLLNRANANFHFGLQWQTNNDNDFFIGLREIGDRNFHVYNYGTTTDALTIKRINGYVGIGTMDPQSNLQVQKTSEQPAIMIGGGFSRSPRLQIYGLDSDPKAWMGSGTDMNEGPYEHSIYFPTAEGGRLTFGDYNGSVYNVRMSVLNNGNVGIGTTTPKSTLAVAGTITAKRIKVTTTDWPDFVFHEGYKLPNLKSIEQYIAEHKHLPEIPSAEDVQKDGVDIGEINKKLLQKIEELTLHLINQQKEIEELKKKVEAR